MQVLGEISRGFSWPIHSIKNPQRFPEKHSFSRLIRQKHLRVHKTLHYEEIVACATENFHDENKACAGIRLFIATMKSHLKDHPDNFIASMSDFVGLITMFLVELDDHVLINFHRNGKFGEILDLLRDAINDYFVLWNIIKFLTVLFAGF